MPVWETKNPRHAHPVYLPEATHFSENRKDLNSLWFMRALKAQPKWHLELKEAIERVREGRLDLTATDEEQEMADAVACAKGGRPRIEADWALLYLAFTASKSVDVHPWWGNAGHSIWRTAGLDERPSYSLVHQRFAELEKLEPLFLTCAQKIIRHAVKRSGGLVGRDLHVDATEAETNARLVHVCDPEKPCMRQSKKPWIKDQKPQGTYVTALLSTKDARKQRQDQVAKTDPEELEHTGPNYGDVEDAEYDKEENVYVLGGCRYKLLDPDAGLRAYGNGSHKGAPGDAPKAQQKKFWAGFFNVKAIDHYTGAPVSVLVANATINEADLYPEVFQRSVDATGQLPRAVVGDRGYHIDKVYEHNTRRGVASVFFYKRPGPYDDRSDEDNDDWDRHGVPRCRHCGGPTTFMRFDQHHHSGPRLVVRCQMPLRECPKAQRVNCSRKWRMLLPMWRNEPAYQALRATHDQYERVHLHWRKRWRVGMDNHELRPKRRGRGCQQLRATVALICEWLVICAREGWLGSARRLRRMTPSVNVVRDYTRQAFEFELFRRSMGLLFSYGSRATALELIPPGPPPNA